jgi:hypothetical protein
MLRTTFIFRALILMSIATGILGAAFELFVPGSVPEVISNAHSEYLAKDLNGTPATVVGFIAVLIVVPSILTTIGLLRLKPWSRRWAFWLTLISALTGPAFSVVLVSGWAYMLLTITSYLWGAVLSMAYFSELRERFKP